MTTLLTGPAAHRMGYDMTVTEPRTITYRLPYMVLADSRLEAITKAVALLRTNVRVLEMEEAEQGVPGWWDVTFLVEETL